MEKIATFLVGRSKVVMGLTAIITLTCLALLFRFQINADITEFMTSGNERGEAYVGVQEKFGGGEPITGLLSVREGDPGFDDTTVLADLARARDTLSQLEGVATVATVIPPKNPISNQPITPETIESLPGFLVERLVEGPAASLLLSEDLRHTMVMIVPAPDADAIAVAGALEDVALPERFEVVYAGNPMVFAEVLNVLGWFLLGIPPVVIVLLLGVFYATIGVRKLAALSVVPAILGSIWTFGLIFGLGNEIDIITVIVPIFVIVMGSADGLHFVSHYRDEVNRTQDEVKRVAATLRQVGVPMILTTVSTAAGFLSLLATDIRPMRQLGVFVAVGIGFAGLISFFTLPALLSRLDIEPSKKPPPLGKPAVAVIKKLVSGPVAAVVLVLGLGTFAAVFIPRLTVNSDPLVYFDEDAPVRKSFERMTEAFGGATPLVGEFAWDPDGDRAAQLSRLRELSRELEAQPGVRRVFSLADADAMLQEANMPEETRAKLFDPEANAGLGRMVSDDGLRFVLFPGEFESEDVQAWLAFADKHAEVRIITGLPVLMDEMSRMVLEAQIGSLSVAFGLVALMLLVAYRRLRPTLVALAPMLLTTATLMGFIAASGIQLHMLTAIVSSIVIGVGIDYAIHYIAAIEYAREQGPGYIHRAIDTAGPPIVANALGIALALSGLLLSPLRPHHQISAIMWVSMITAALSALVLISIAYRER
jgi:hypothetical protein